MTETLRILILEDVPTDAELTMGELRRAGIDFVARCVETREDYVTALSEFDPHVVLSDYSLPLFDGMTALRLALDLAPTVPVILVTGSMSEEIAVEVMKAGAADYLLKNDLGRLGPALRGAVEKRRLLAERSRAEEARREVEKELRQKNEILQAIFDQIPVMIGFVDSSGRLTLANREWERVFGWSLEEAQRIDFWSETYPDPEERRRLLEFMERSEGQWGLFKTTVRDGRALDTTWAIVRLAEGTRVAIGQDLSELRKVDERVAKLSRAVEDSPVSVVITGRDGSIEYVNRKFTAATGYEASEVLGKNPRFLKSGATPQGVYEDLWRTIAAGGEWRGELQNKRKNGEFFWEDASISGIRNEDGQITHYVAVKEDITQRKRAEEALHQSQQQLLQSQKMEAIGRLAGGIAHDFNNLLNVIQGYAELLLKALSPEGDARAKVEQILKATDRAAGLTRQLLAFSRKQVLAPRVLNLEAIVADTEIMLRRVIGEDVELTVSRHPPLGHVKADPSQIEQVLLNLAVNARDAMPNGGTLTIELANADLDEAYAATHEPVVPGRYVMLAVSDTGIGMDAETRSHVFEPFFTTKERGKGTGLGLATAYGIVKQSDGFIWVYSELGHGSTFKVYLPRIEGKAEHPAVATKATAPKGAGETILLVEDEPSVRELVQELLEANGYAVVSAANAADGLAAVGRHPGPIHLLLTDVVMPGLSGRELAERLKPLRPETKVLFMSGYTNDAISHHGILEPGVQYVQKPFTEATLAEAVRRTLRG